MSADLAHDLRPDPAFDGVGAGPGARDLGSTRGPAAAAQNKERPASPTDAQIRVLASVGPTHADGADAQAVRRIPTEHVHPGRLQPRRHFDEDALRALAGSIEEQGVLQPIVVRPHPHREGRYEIVAGERRWRAARLAGKAEIPAIVRDLSDQQTLAVALVENLQRRDLSPLETAQGYRRLIDEHGCSHDHVARLVGKSRSQVANTLRLLSLPEAVKELLHDGALSAGHARALLGAERPEELARHVVAKGLSVRQAERLARRRGALSLAGRGGPPARPPEIETLERELSDLLGVRASISATGRGGALTLHYASLGAVRDLLLALKAVRVSAGPPRARPEPKPADAGSPILPARNVDAYGPASGPLPQRELMARGGTSRTV